MRDVRDAHIIPSLQQTFSNRDESRAVLWPSNGRSRLSDAAGAPNVTWQKLLRAMRDSARTCFSSSLRNCLQMHQRTIIDGSKF